MMMIEALQERLRKEGTLTLSIRVRPGAPRTEIKDVLSDGSIKVNVAAAPEDGEANAALIRFLADSFDVPQDHVTLVSGHRGRRKIVRITAM